MAEQSFTLRKFIAAIFAAAIFSASAANYAVGQNYFAAQPERTEIPSEALATALKSVIEQGMEYEAQKKWASALTTYEDALRDYPTDAGLSRRHKLAKLHYSLARRYRDESYTKSIKTISNNEALKSYTDVLLKLQTHYVGNPQWRDLVVLGTTSLEIALADPDFQQLNMPGVRAETVRQLQNDIYQIVGKHTIRTRFDAANVVAAVVRHAQSRAGLSPNAVYLEYTAATASGLDNYSGFLSAGQHKELFSQIKGNFVGLGVELKSDDQGLLIVKVINGSPAQRAGVKSGDHITQADGHNTVGISTEKAGGYLSGTEGSTAQLIVLSPGLQARRVFVRREHIDVPGVEDVKILDSTTGIAYLKIPAFQESTSKDLDTALWKLYNQGMRTLILDLRGNPGGLLNASVEAADKFIAEGGIVSTKGRNPLEDFNFRAHKEGTWRVPLIVLIDGDSASASEVFAGAIRDSRRGTVIGEQSYGKGSVQGIFPIGSTGMGLRLTVAKFYSPSGAAISKVGVTPDIVVRQVAKPAPGTENAGQLNSGRDAVLEAAIQRFKRRKVASK